LFPHVPAYLADWIHRAVPPNKTDKLPSGSQWLHEIKHDGFRVIARKKSMGSVVRWRR
jgi:ATP-dependent DNA ligase